MPRTIIPSKSRLLAAVLFCAAAVFPVSCNTGKESYFFDRTDGTDDSTYVFSFGMKGFPSVYDVSFYTRLEGKNMDFYNSQAVSMDILLVSPSGKDYREHFDFVPGDARNAYSGIRDISIPYREGVSVDEPGEWKMTVTVARQDAYMAGLGLYLKEREEER